MSERKKYLTRLSHEDFDKLRELSNEFTNEWGIDMPINSLVNIAVKELLKKDKEKIIKDLTK